jgi:hypothetical protein
VKDNPVNYRSSIDSQWGEDGIIEEIFKRIGTRNNVCVEVGAWDGKYLSNTWNLWHEKDWSALLVEGNAERVISLEKNAQGYEGVKICTDYVSIDGPSSLDSLLAKHDLPKDFDLLSIDIDGDDYHVFDSMRTFTPRLVIVEYNPTVPPEVDLVQLPGEYFGASASSLVKLAHTKGYKLVCCTETNCFFVFATEYDALGIQEPVLRDVFPLDNLTYVVTAQDGRAFLTRQPTYSGLSSASLSGCLKMQKVRSSNFPKLAGASQIIPILLRVPRDAAIFSKSRINKLCGKIGLK